MPSVIFLIATGIIIKEIMRNYDIDLPNHFISLLDVLGGLGLLLIVLEASLELSLTREKVPLIKKSFGLAVSVFLITTVAIAFTVMFLSGKPFANSLIFAIPLSVVSSAIVIPSVHGLEKSKKEFIIYESTFSDIIGVMFFYFVILQVENVFSMVGIFNVILSLFLSFIISFALIIVSSHLKTQNKLFLMLSILIMFYLLGKLFHFSSLLIILIFGLMLNNTRLFTFKGAGKLINFQNIKKFGREFRLLTIETTFIVRTFFFVAFGMAIDLEALWNLQIILAGSAIVVILYAVRYVYFKMFIKTTCFPEIFLSPRGLVTIVLFYSIPAEYLLPDYSINLLFFVILVTSIIMSIALITSPISVDKPDDLTVVDIGLAPAGDYDYDYGFDDEENNH